MSLLLAGCYQTVHISQLTRNPQHWANKDIHLAGTVTNSFGAMGYGMYTLNDGTGSIKVISTNGVPNNGNRVDVVGQVFQGLNFMGRNLALAFRQSKYRVH